MKCSATYLITALLVLQIPAALCSRWWSIVSGSDVFNPKDKKTPIHLQCSSFDRILTQKQMRLCSQHTKLLSTAAIGTLEALNQCQRKFKDRAWNCSVFDSNSYYLGRFIENCTRETAFLNGIISAGIAREVARKCKEQELAACGCDFSVGSSTNNEDATTIIGGCGDNCEFGVKIAEEFTCPDTTESQSECCNLTTLHNNKVGRMLVKKTTIKCICHGVSGSCSVQTCFKKVPDIDELATEILQKYDAAKHVRFENGMLVPPLLENELGYCNFSPNFCRRDLPNGIYGTSGRRCYPNRNDHSSCASMCCGGRVEQRIVDVPEDTNTCCKFKWCCYLDCSECGTIKETQYFCK